MCFCEDDSGVCLHSAALFGAENDASRSRFLVVEQLDDLKEKASLCWLMLTSVTYRPSWVGHVIIYTTRSQTQKNRACESFLQFSSQIILLPSYLLPHAFLSWYIVCLNRLVSVSLFYIFMYQGKAGGGICYFPAPLKQSAMGPGSHLPATKKSFSNKLRWPIK